MKRIIGMGIMIAMLYLCAGAAAVPQNTVMGPYNVSFVLGTDDPLIITPLAGMHYETLEGGATIDRAIEIESHGGFTILNIEELQEDGDFWAEVCAKDMELSFVWPEDQITDYVSRTIDGQPGWVGHGQWGTLDKLVYIAKYNTHNATAGVFIASLYPWDEGTLSLLETIHIERQNT